MELHIKGVSQAGDTFLLAFACPTCNNHQFQGYPLKGCNDCWTMFENMPLLLPRHRKHYTLLAGTKRKHLSSNKALIRKLFAIQGNICMYCDCDLAELEYHIDHIVPLAVGGSNNISNLCIACKRCNLLASSFVFNSLFAKRVFLLKRKKL